MFVRTPYLFLNSVSLPDNYCTQNMSSPLFKLQISRPQVGPRNTYPAHAHAAHEAYHVLAGEAWLSKNNSAHARKKAGDVVVHDPYDAHAMVTGEKSVLVCWVNSGDTFGKYYFVDS